jgi:SSS family solute:Na+ symporter
VAFWVLFDAMTTLSGLYARALLPDLAQPAMAYPALAEAVLPAVAKGVFYLGMVATVMSTTDGLTFISAATIGRDVLAPLFGRREDHDILLFTRVGVIFTAAVAVCGALLFPSVIQLWYVIGTVFIPGLLLPVLLAYSRHGRPTPSWTFAMMMAGFLCSFAWFSIGVLDGNGLAPRYLFGIEPMYVGLGATMVLLAAAILLRRTSGLPRPV